MISTIHWPVMNDNENDQNESDVTSSENGTRNGNRNDDGADSENIEATAITNAIAGTANAIAIASTNADT